MYEIFYGLRDRAFDLALNPRQLLLTPQHREALSNLEHGIRARVGTTLLTGEAGTGKTTLIRAAFARAESEAPGSTVSWAFLRNPTLTRTEFLEFLAARFELSAAAEQSKMRLLDELEQRLRAGLRAALIVDEAQSVPLELLEEVRLLANIESDSEKLFPVVLVGQPELTDRLNQPNLRQLKQRIALRCALAPLSLHETAAYIVARIENAGGQPAGLFSREAILAIHQRSGGIPRTINVICENALMTGYADELRPVGRTVIEAVCRDFDLAAHAAQLPKRAPAAAMPVPDGPLRSQPRVPDPVRAEPETTVAAADGKRRWRPW